MAIIGEPITVKALRLPDGITIARAWGHSRPNETLVNIKDVLEVDTPVNELEDFILEVRCPIMFREMFFTIRDHVAWARTSRVDNLDDWPVHTQWADQPLIRNAHAAMHEARKTGVQDHFRLHLPLCYMTGFTIKLSARTMMRFRSALNKLLFGMSEWDFARQAVYELITQLNDVIDKTPFGELNVSHYGALDLLPKFSVPVDGKSLGHFMIIDVEQVPIALRAQVVRHRPVMLFDTLHKHVSFDGMMQPISTPVDMQLMMTRDTALAMVRKRNCWIAQEDLWSPIIQKLNWLFEDDSGTVGVPLPCDACLQCPVGRDNMLRYEGKDPAPPCPIWMNENHLEPSAEQRVSMVRYLGDRPLTNYFWQNKYLENTPDQGA